MENFAKRSSHDYRVDFHRITGFSVSVLKSETILALENKSFIYKSLKMFLSSISYLNRGNSACNYTANYVAKDRLKAFCAQPKSTFNWRHWHKRIQSFRGWRKGYNSTSGLDSVVGDGDKYSHLGTRLRFHLENFRWNYLLVVHLFMNKFKILYVATSFLKLINFWMDNSCKDKQQWGKAGSCWIAGSAIQNNT